MTKSMYAVWPVVKHKVNAKMVAIIEDNKRVQCVKKKVPFHLHSKCISECQQ